MILRSGLPEGMPVALLVKEVSNANQIKELHVDQDQPRTAFVVEVHSHLTVFVAKTQTSKRNLFGSIHLTVTVLVAQW